MRWANENSMTYLENGYLIEGQTLEGRVREIADKAEKLLNKKGFADKFYDYMEKGYYSLSSPVWSNFWLDRGLPISCFWSYVDDHMSDILWTQAEIGMMSKFGGGSSAYFWALRPRGAEIKNNGHSSGSVHFMQMFSALIDTISQGSVRRGHLSPYLPIDHGDIEEFLKIGTEGHPIQNLTHGVTVTDKWLEEMKGGDVEKRKVWAEVIQRRGEVGYPYIMFVDNANNFAPDCYKGKHTIHASNMCSEIMLPSSRDWSFVCDLSSMNVFYYDEWKDTDAVETLTYFLDAVMQEFINKLEQMRDSGVRELEQGFTFMEKAHRFAVENRAIGIGAIGYHSYLQEKMIPFEDFRAVQINKEIFSLIKDKSYAASAEMAKIYGEPKVCEGFWRRNATTMAIAPTSSSAFILGQVSQSIEPWWSNCYVKDLAKIKTTIKNKSLEKLLLKKIEDMGLSKTDATKEMKKIWNLIKKADGSVQGLDILTQDEKNVFKTFPEINQYAIIDQAADRQKFIDQGQSLNIAVNPKATAKEINALYMDAHKQGLKTLYYQHSKNAAQELNREIGCVWCEG